MKLRLSLALIALIGLQPAAHALDVTGAGATFVYPLMSKWAATYQETHKVRINYQSIGSGGGIKQIQAKTVAFGATDKPLNSEELKKDNLIQFPIVNGGVVPVVNIPGIAANTLKLDGELIAQIFMGKITKWNAPEIMALNKDLKLPAMDITVVRRSDGSGTSFIWTNYLSKVSEAWKTSVGEGTAVQWPVGVGGKGNEGVASYVQRIEGSIGYVEFAYAEQNKMSFTQVKNSAGIFVTPSLESFQAAAEGAEWAKAQDFFLILTNAPGKKSWPIAGSTFALMQRDQLDSEIGKATLDFFRWAYKNGPAAARELDYVPFPPKVVALIEKSWKSPSTAKK